MGDSAVLVTGPTNSALLVSDLKDHLRVTTSADDVYIDLIAEAALLEIEAETRRKLITQTWKLYQDAFRGSTIVLPFGSLQSVTSIKYTDVDDVEATVDAATYFLADWEEPARIILNDGESWPTTSLRPAGGVVTEFVVGYGADGADVPEALRHAMRLIVGHLYENRESVVIGQGLTPVQVPNAARHLAMPYRMLGV